MPKGAGGTLNNIALPIDNHYSNQNIKERHETFNTIAECPQLLISQVGQKIPPIKLRYFFKSTNQWLQIAAPDRVRLVRPPHKSVKNHMDQSNDRIRHSNRSKLMQKPVSPFLTD